MTTSDDGVREIQLHGKQLVFLFMAVAVVSVVIFLCGVLVGRGVQGRGVQGGAVPAQQPDPLAETAPEPPVTPPAGPTKAEGLDYSDRLQTAGQSSETLVSRPDPSPTPSAAAPSTPKTPAARPEPTVQTADAPVTGAAVAGAGDGTIDARATPIAPEPKGDGVAIQVAALRGRAEAEAVVSRLKGKGYSAYLMPPPAGQPSMFRVRVGKFNSRAEAEKVAARLEREEQFKPWITR